MTLVDLAITAATIAIAIGILLYALKRNREMKLSVGGLISEVESLTRQIQGYGGRATFKANYRSLTEAVRGKRPLEAAWREYTSALVDLGTDGPIGATRPASLVFSSDLPYRAGIDLKRYDAVPNTLIGVGLLFTFIGLAGSIYLAQAGSGDTEQTLAALSNLLQAASFKFVTSIAAIFASLMFSASRHRILDKLDNALDRLCEVLDAMTVPATEAQLAEAARTQLEAQTGILAKRDDKLARAIASALDTTLRENLGTALDPIASQINAMGAQLGAQNVQALNDMVQRFAKELGGAARDHTDALVGLLDQAGRSMRGAPDAINAAGLRFSEVVDQGSLAFAGRINASTESLAMALTTSQGALVTLSGRMEAFANDLAALEGRLAERANAFDNSSAVASAALVSAAGRLEAAASLAAPLAQVSDQLVASAAAISTGMRGVESIGQGGVTAAAALAGTAQAYAASLDRLDATIAAVFTRIAANLEQMDRSIIAAAPYEMPGTDAPKDAKPEVRTSDDSDLKGEGDAPVDLGEAVNLDPLPNSPQPGGSPVVSLPWSPPA